MLDYIYIYNIIYSYSYTYISIYQHNGDVSPENYTHKAVQAVTIKTFTREVSVSKLGQKTNHSEVFPGLPSSRQGKSAIVP